MSGPDIGASIRARLLNKAKAEGQDFNLVLTRYALERLLYRLGASRYAERFLLEGTLLFDLWFDIPHRPTRDADLLGFGPAEAPALEAVFRDLCAQVVEPEHGIDFRGGDRPRRGNPQGGNYGGIRVTLVGLLAGARCAVEVDVGFGDAVTPAPERVEYPTLLPELPVPRLRAYPPYTVVAEKLEALVTLGIANSRMKDFFDLRVLASHADFDGDTLARAIRATLERRATQIPDGVPFGLTEAFAEDPRKLTRWRAFLARSSLDPEALESAKNRRGLSWECLNPPVGGAKNEVVLSREARRTGALGRGCGLR